MLVGLFNVLDQERGSVMAGLDRFGRRQKELAAEIRGDNEKLRALQTEPASDPKAVQQMTQQVNWEVEVFQDRRQALSYACDVPRQDRTAAVRARASDPAGTGVIIRSSEGRGTGSRASVGKPFAVQPSVPSRIPRNMV